MIFYRDYRGISAQISLTSHLQYLRVVHHPQILLMSSLTNLCTIALIDSMGNHYSMIIALFHSSSYSLFGMIIHPRVCIIALDLRSYAIINTLV